MFPQHEYEAMWPGGSLCGFYVPGIGNCSMPAPDDRHYVGKEKIVSTKEITIVKCLCGEEICDYYGLSDGAFHQGTGWPRMRAQEYADAINAYEKNQETIATLKVIALRLQGSPCACGEYPQGTRCLSCDARAALELEDEVKHVN